MTKKITLLLIGMMSSMLQSTQAYFTASQAIQIATACALYADFTIPKLQHVKREMTLDRPDMSPRVSNWVRNLLQKSNLNAELIAVKISSPEARYNWCALGSSLIMGNQKDVDNINTILHKDAKNSAATKFMDRMTGIVHHESKHLLENDLQKATYVLAAIPLCTTGILLVASKCMPTLRALSYTRSVVLGVIKAIFDIALVTKYVRTQEAAADKHSFECMKTKESLENYIHSLWPYDRMPTLAERIDQWICDPEHPHLYDRAEMGRTIMAERFSTTEALEEA